MVRVAVWTDVTESPSSFRPDTKAQILLPRRPSSLGMRRLGTFTGACEAYGIFAVDTFRAGEPMVRRECRDGQRNIEDDNWRDVVMAVTAWDEVWTGGPVL